MKNMADIDVLLRICEAKIRKGGKVGKFRDQQDPDVLAAATMRSTLVWAFDIQTEIKSDRQHSQLLDEMVDDWRNIEKKANSFGEN